MKSQFVYDLVHFTQKFGADALFFICFFIGLIHYNNIGKALLQFSFFKFFDKPLWTNPTSAVANPLCQEHGLRGDQWQS
jgi:hypothetical protein